MLHDLIARAPSDPLPFYTVLAGLIYAAVGVLIWAVGLESAKRPYLTWALMLPPIFALLWLGHWFWIAGVAVLSALGFREFARATGVETLKLHGAIVYLLIAGLAACAGAKNYGLFMALPVWAMALLLAIPVLTGRYEGALRDLGVGAIGIIYFAWFPAHLGFLAQSSYGLGYVLFVVLATQFCDVIAFVTGKLFGRTHWTRVSPNKTIEASLIALVAGIALAYANWPFLFPQFEWWLVGIAGLIVGIGGQMGDLVMSAFKRDLGIKDFGDALPGHGGFLDRMDSLIWVAPIFFHTARFFHGGFGY
jgi:phosphatidate cytidylyltransferase